MASDKRSDVARSVQDDRDRNRYEARTSDGALMGIAGYQRHDDRIVVTHTEVDDAYEGQGVGSALAREVLEQARSHGIAVEPQCPFVRSYIQRHPQYQDLLPLDDPDA